jgi:hypothetical protein
MRILGVVRYSFDKSPTIRRIRADDGGRDVTRHRSLSLSDAVRPTPTAMCVTISNCSNAIDDVTRLGF